MFATYGATVVSGTDWRGELDRDPQYGVFLILGKQNPVIIEVDSDNPPASRSDSRSKPLSMYSHLSCNLGEGLSMKHMCPRAPGQKVKWWRPSGLSSTPLVARPSSQQNAVAA